MVLLGEHGMSRRLVFTEGARSLAVCPSQVQEQRAEMLKLKTPSLYKFTPLGILSQSLKAKFVEDFGSNKRC